MLELVTYKEAVIGFEEDVGTGLFVALLGDVPLQSALFKVSLSHLAVAVATYLKAATQGVDRLDAHTIQTYTLLKGLRIILTAGVQLADGLDQLALRNATAIISNSYTQVILDGDLDALTGPHLKLVDAIVHHLLK